MTSASGLQIAFLFFALQFLAMLVTRFLSDLWQWPQSAFLMMSQWIAAFLQLLVLLVVPAIRRWCLAELRVPIPAGRWPELASMMALKAAVPFAVLGGGVVWMLAWAPPGTLPPGYRFNDPSLAWEATLMPARILHQVLIAWLAGPFLEELVFRGLLFRAFERQLGWLYAAVATSVLFGLAHPDRMIASGLGGLVLACVLRRTGSLRACVLVHALYNVLVSWPLLGQVLLSPRPGDLGSPVTWGLPLACLAFVAVALPACLWLAARPESCAATGAPAPR
jgi:membrane protease YdiL (CAAX protease family)